MNPTPFYKSELYNRREFVLATGLIVAGGLISCGRNENDKKQADSINLPKLSEPIFIRVRIGRKTKNIIAGNINISRNKNKWIGVNESGESEVTFTLQPNTKLTVDTTDKILSGKIVLHPSSTNPDKTFDVVAHIPIEDYLPGVLAGELFAHWHPSTFAAQAVAARSYAASHHFERKSTSYFDMNGGPSSQMFLGEVTLDIAHRAVQETRGVVLRWDDRIIPAYYSSCCGGLPATAIDEISSAEQHNIQPLCGHEGVDICTSLSVHSWKTERSARVLRKRLNACATSMQLPELAHVRSISSIHPAATNKHGRTTHLVIKGRRGDSVEIRTRDFIRAVNATVFNVPDTKNHIWSSFVIGEKDGASIYMNGLGMGHGVGLCQYGAQELAGKGESWKDILKWYYPGATINT